MTWSSSFLQEFDHECATTRKTLERLPANKFDWKPHEKSMTLGHLATHLAHLPTWALMTIQEDALDAATVPSPELPASTEELLQRFDAGVSAAREAIASASDERLFANWSLLMGGKPAFTMPRVVVLRSFIMNHSIHHRAQLGVYLRLNDIAVPSTYGPSGDEGQM